MTADDERPAVWVIDPDDPSGATRHPGREHGRFVDDRGEHVIVLFDRGAVRDYRVVSPERVEPRDVETWVDVEALPLDPPPVITRTPVGPLVVPRTTEEPTSDGQES